MDSKTKDLRRLHDLVRLALDSGASTEEARTAAMAAVRIVSQHKLYEPAKPVVKYINISQPQPKYKTEDKSKARFITAKYVAMCPVCSDWISPGVRCVWIPDTKKILHKDCYASTNY